MVVNILTPFEREIGNILFSFDSFFFLFNFFMNLVRKANLRPHFLISVQYYIGIQKGSRSRGLRSGAEPLVPTVCSWLLRSLTKRSSGLVLVQASRNIFYTSTSCDPTRVWYNHFHQLMIASQSHRLTRTAFGFYTQQNEKRKTIGMLHGCQ